MCSVNSTLQSAEGYKLHGNNPDLDNNTISVGWGASEEDYDNSIIITSTNTKEDYDNSIIITSTNTKEDYDNSIIITSTNTKDASYGPPRILAGNAIFKRHALRFF